MRQIFSQAAKTFIWLGAEADESNKAFDLFELFSEIHQYYRSLTDSPFIDHGAWGPPSSWRIADELIALERLLARPWWHRIWVVQEVAVSQEVWACCGTHQCSWDLVEKAYIFLQRHVTQLEDIIALHPVSNYHQHGPLFVRRGILRVQSIYAARFAFAGAAAEIRKSPERSLFSLLTRNSAAGATDERDKCVAIAGLTYEGAFLLPTQPYLHSINDIYILAAKSIAKEEYRGPLNFLEYSGQPRKRSDLPSWVPDWSYIGNRHNFLLHPQRKMLKHPELVPYNSAVGPGIASRGSFYFQKEDDTLFASGFVFDFVGGIAACPCDSFEISVTHTQAEDHAIQQPEYETLQQNKDDFQHVFAQLWRTLVANRDGMQRLPPENWARIFSTTLLYLGQDPDVIEDEFSHELNDWYKINRHFKICGSTVEEIIRMWGSCGSNLTSTDIATMAEIRQQIWLITFMRRLSNTRKGKLSLVPAVTRRGDMVVILFDCQVPCVLRRHEGHYEFVGSCYVHEIMEGQAMVGFRHGEFKAETFAIR
jgi:hypothetical protein